MSESQEKPKFDKKKWRTQKYSKKARGKHVIEFTFHETFSSKACKSSQNCLNFYNRHPGNSRIFLHCFLHYFKLVDEWQAKRKKYIQGKYFRMLQKEGMSKNPNLVPLGDKSERFVLCFHSLVNVYLDFSMKSSSFSVILRVK